MAIQYASHYGQDILRCLIVCQKTSQKLSQDRCCQNQGNR